MNINNEDAVSKELIQFKNDDKDIKISADQTTGAILLLGEPIEKKYYHMVRL